MNQERIEVGKAPLIMINECHGDLVVRSWAETAVLIKGDDYEANETDTGLSLSGQNSLRLTIPAQSSLVVQTVHGDLIVKKVQGSISLQNISGDAQLISVGAVKIGAIHADLAAKRIDGSLNIETIYGDAAIRGCDDLAVGAVYGDLLARNVRGMAQIGEVMGDIALRTVSGDVTIKQGSRDVNLNGLDGSSNIVANAAGDIRLHGPLNAGQHTFAANGDIVLRWPADADISVAAVAPHIKNRLPLEEVVEDGDKLNGFIGDGNTGVSLQANGRIILKETQPVKEKWAYGDEFDFNFDFDLSSLGDLINSQVMDHFNEITANFETKFGPEFTDKIARKAEQAAAKAEQAAERAMRQMERSMKRSGWIHRSPSPPRSPKPPAPVKQKASSAEQLKILKMVEKGVISPEEAGTLLQALES